MTCLTSQCNCTIYHVIPLSWFSLLPLQLYLDWLGYCLGLFSLLLDIIDIFVLSLLLRCLELRYTAIILDILIGYSPFPDCLNWTKAYYLSNATAKNVHRSLPHSIRIYHLYFIAKLNHRFSHFLYGAYFINFETRSWTIAPPSHQPLI